MTHVVVMRDAELAVFSDQQSAQQFADWLIDEVQVDYVAIVSAEDGDHEVLHLPETSVGYGEALDLRWIPAEHIADDDSEIKTDFEIDGAWQMLVTEDAFDLQPGECPLYLVRGQLSAVRDEQPSARAARNYLRWHKRQPAGVRDTREVPKAALFYMGLAATIGYRSDKWHKRGVTEDYTHDFFEDGGEPPEVWADVPDLDRASLIVLIGGSMYITEDGIS